MDLNNRIMKVVNWQPVDRVPIEPPIPIDLVRWSEGWRPEAGWMAEDNYLAVAEMAAEHCDAFWAPPGMGPLFDRRFALIPRDNIHVVSDETVGGRRTITTVVSTPKGDLRTVEAADAGVSTMWYPEPL